jgi:hypothetical protein
MRPGWQRWMYSLVIATYPRRFRDEYASEMRIVFNDLMLDVRPSDLALRLLKDLWGGIRMNGSFIRRGVVLGFLVLGMWIVGRTLHPGLYLGIPLVATPFLFFIVVGFIGARMSSSFSGGITLALLTGLVSAVSVLGDYVLFNFLPFNNLYEFVLSMTMAGSFCLAPATLGAALARLPDIQRRVRRSTAAFAGAWKAPA